MKNFILGFIIGFSEVATYFYKDLTTAFVLAMLYGAMAVVIYSINKIGI